MSYDICLRDPNTNEVVQLDESHDLRGGTYAMGGTPEAWLNITYNYGGHYYRLLGEKGIRSIYGQTAEATRPALQAAADRLGDDVADDYWAPTEGNAKAALLNLIALGDLAPHGVWDGD